MKRTIFRLALGMLSLAAVLTPSALSAQPVGVKVIIENMAPDNGTYLTPFWVGFHDGTFDTHTLGLQASMELERLAEDGNADPLLDAFDISGSGNTQAVMVSNTGIPPLAPGETATMIFTLDAGSPKNRFFSYASMVIPSNDAFVGNADAPAHQIFDGSGNFLGAFIVISGSAVKDAGTEVNDEIPDHTAFFGQTIPNTGVDENGVVHLHPGYLPPGSGGILDDPMFANADFTAPGYEAARITIIRTDTVIPGGDVSGTWNLAGSPYLVEGDIVVPVGETLTIEPGVVVFFKSWYSLTVNGTLEAVGTEADPILFTATPPGPGEPGWKGIRFVNAPDGSRLSYCTVENGKVTGVEPYKRGGAVSLENSNVVIDHCTLRGNRALEAGGALYIIGSSPVIEDNIIVDNLVGYGTFGSGGGIYASNSGGTISGNLIADNMVDVFNTFGPSNARGGGVYLFNYDGVLSRNTIVGNNADASGNVGTHAFGGGIYCNGNGPSSLLQFTNNTVSNNSATIGAFYQDGGGMYLTNTNATIVNNIVEGNLGSGLHLDDNTSATVAYGNFSANGRDNFTGSSIPAGLGDIVRTNANDDPCDAYFNIFLDPLFEDPAGGDFRLQEESPCIDAGDPATPIDPDGTLADMGAFLFEQDPLLTADAYILSSSPGGDEINFSLDAGVMHAGRDYILLGGLSGIKPGTTLPGGQVTLPLNVDAFTLLAFSLANTPIFSGFAGTLDGSGTAAAQLNSPGALPPELSGALVHFAYALPFPWNLASNPAAVKIEP